MTPLFALYLEQQAQDALCGLRIEQLIITREVIVITTCETVVEVWAVMEDGKPRLKIKVPYPLVT